MNIDSNIYIAGVDNLIGRGLWDYLISKGYSNIVTSDSNLLEASSVDAFFDTHRPEYVFFAAARMGGIQANIDYPAQYLLDNLKIECNVIDAAYRFSATKLFYLASSCIYPRECSQPILEEYLLSGPLEKTNESYAVGRIAGVKLCEAYNKQYGAHFVPCMLANIYGPYDDSDQKTSHVVPALLGKFHNAMLRGENEVEVWGSGRPRREFLFTRDLARAITTIALSYSETALINVGVGSDVTISELAHLIADVVGFKGILIFDPKKPDGTPQKLLDVSRLTSLGFAPTTSLRLGIEQTYAWYRSHVFSSISSQKTRAEHV